MVTAKECDTVFFFYCTARHDHRDRPVAVGPVVDHDYDRAVATGEHTFHLPISEATITLQDVGVLYGLLDDGHSVAYRHALRDYTGLQYLQMLQWLTGFQPAEEVALSGASHLQLTPIQLHLEAMDADITDDTQDLHIDRYTRLLMLLMFGEVLFPNTSENLVSFRFLHHLERLDDLPGYSWGADVLGYLYRQMCRASMGTQRDIAGFFSLLQVKT
ncbi:protein MAIN-LIKE 2-like [Nicotiana tomentosiformis]|uniref:protein MAIN-LIKE 2-like n=1 Tax=Nicotiana tomentosiformis TaxID=4098 RepID=UPI00388C6BE8